MTESADGFSVAAIRQCAGSTGPAGAAAAPRPPPRPPAPAPSPRPPGAAPSPRPPPRPAPSPRPAAGATGPPGGPPGAGATYGPAATSCAEVMVMLESESVRSDSHGAACASAAISPSAVTVIMGRYCSARTTIGSEVQGCSGFMGLVLNKTREPFAPFEPFEP